jgi:hypothetical protein
LAVIVPLPVVNASHLLSDAQKIPGLVAEPGMDIFDLVT